MPSLIFNRLLELWARGSIDFDTDTFRVTLHTSGYAEDKDAHDFFNDVTNEVVGTGYTAGGNVVTVTVTLDTVNDRLDISLGGTTWPSSTITARKAVYRKARGGASSADELVAVNDFGADVISVAGTFTLNASTIRITNP
ncbi:hypothetical protein [Hydrogenophaga sp.]